MGKKKQILPYWPDVITEKDGARKNYIRNDLFKWLLKPSCTKLEAALILTGFLPLDKNLSEDILEYREKVIGDRIVRQIGNDLITTSEFYNIILKDSSKFNEFSPKDYIKWAFNDQLYRWEYMPQIYRELSKEIKQEEINTTCIDKISNNPKSRFSATKVYSFNGLNNKTIEEYFVKTQLISLIDYLDYFLRLCLESNEKNVGKLKKKLKRIRRWTQDQKRTAMKERKPFHDISWKKNWEESIYRLEEKGISTLKDFKKCYDAARQSERRKKK